MIQTVTLTWCFSASANNPEPFSIVTPSLPESLMHSAFASFKRFSLKLQGIVLFQFGITQLAMLNWWTRVNEKKIISFFLVIISKSFEISVTNKRKYCIKINMRQYSPFVNSIRLIILKNIIKTGNICM